LNNSIKKDVWFWGNRGFPPGGEVHKDNPQTDVRENKDAALVAFHLFFILLFLINYTSLIVFN
jgi:hypothetical protein